MALKSSLITGRIPLPTDQPLARARLIFTLSGWDSAGTAIIPPAPVQILLGPEGALPAGFALWQNIEGDRGTHYAVTLRWEEPSHVTGAVWREIPLGRIQLGEAASYVLADLLRADVIPAGESHWVAAGPDEVATLLGAASALSGYTGPGYLAGVEAGRAAAEAAAGQATLARLAADAAADRAQVSGLTLARWDLLAALTGATPGSGAEVLDADSGSHSDPVTGETVPNAGRYSWQAAPPGWQRIGTTGLSARLERTRFEARVHETSCPGILAGMTDALGNLTWIAARDSDGGPHDLTMGWLRRRLAETGSLVERQALAGLTRAGLDPAGNLDWQSSDDQGLPPLWLRPVLGRLLSPYIRHGGADPLPPVATELVALGSSTMDYMAPRLQAEVCTPLGISLVNGAKNGELGEHSYARLGSRLARLVFPGDQIPASGGVSVTLMNVALDNNSFLRPFTGRANGVPGTLSHAGGNTFTFSRTAPGAAVPAPQGTVFLPDLLPQHRASPVLMNICKNNLHRAAYPVEDSIAMARQALDHLARANRRVLVMGHFQSTNTPADDAQRDRISHFNTALREMVGEALFIDQGLYIAGQPLADGSTVWDHSGIVPGPEDLAQCALLNKPPALSLSGDVYHLNAAAETALCRHVILPKLRGLGWFA